MDAIARMEDELVQLRALLEEQADRLHAVGLIVAHTHEDVRGLRELARLYDPACYEPPAGDE